MTERSKAATFKPRARLLLLLGDQLIRDAGIAVFELVKNAYDADATSARVTLRNPASQGSGMVIVEDDGSGMDFETVTGVWLEPGTDFRAEQRRSAKPRTPKFKRLPLGEKGVGRFAAGKLGGHVRLITRSADCGEVVVDVDWEILASQTYLEDAHLQVTEREPLIFTNGRTGTRLEVSRLHEPWTRGRVRALQRSMTSITSPFAGPTEFATELILQPDPGWLDDLPAAEDILAQAPYRADGVIRGNQLTYSYSFEPPSGLRAVAPRAIAEQHATVMSGRDQNSGGVDLDDVGVGPVHFMLHAYDLDARTLQMGSLPPKAVRDYLKSNGGIRVYRDGVRVFDYGEPGDDWLDLGARRVNVPGERLSNNLVIGAVHLSLDESVGLIEKTNREGFVENRAYDALVDAVVFALNQITAERNIDKLKLRRGTSKTREPVTDALAELRRKLKDRPELPSAIFADVERIEREYVDSRDRLMTAAGTGLQLIVVIHEVEKGVSELVKAVERDVDPARVRKLAQHLSELIEGLTFLTRRSGRSVEKASALARQALFNTEFRLRAHRIELTNGFTLGHPDFAVRCTRRLVVATLMNLIDNAIYWSDVAAIPRDRSAGRPKRIYIGPSLDRDHSSSIIVADNGFGFQDDPAVLTQALVSRRPEGMGIGLHLADQVMRAHGGRLEFPEPSDAQIPEGFDGAVVALTFDPESVKRTVS